MACVIFPVGLLKRGWLVAWAQTLKAGLVLRQWWDLGRKHRRAEQVIAEAGAMFWKSLRPRQEGLGLGQMSLIYNQPGEDGTFWKAIEGPMRCRFWLPCCAPPAELVLCWRGGTQDHADRPGVGGIL